VKARQKAKGPLEPAELEEAALRYLDRFDCSSAKLRAHIGTLISRRGGDGATLRRHLEHLVERYRSSGLLDDARFARNLSERLKSRGASRRAIVEKLRVRGVPTAVAEEAVPRSDEGELESARAYVKRRRLGPFRPEDDRARYRHKDLAALARAGFGRDVAVRALGHGGEDDF
jgi:regulatory protein